MGKRVYITEEERAKCQKVADAFTELKYYKPPHGFEEDATYTDSRTLFDALWQEWFNTTLYLTAKEMQLNDIFYEEVFNCLPKEKRSAIIGRKAVLVQKAGITL